MQDCDSSYLAPGGKRLGFMTLSSCYQLPHWCLWGLSLGCVVGQDLNRSLTSIYPMVEEKWAVNGNRSHWQHESKNTVPEGLVPERKPPPGPLSEPFTWGTWRRGVRTGAGNAEGVSGLEAYTEMGYGARSACKEGCRDQNCTWRMGVGTGTEAVKLALRVPGGAQASYSGLVGDGAHVQAGI